MHSSGNALQTWVQAKWVSLLQILYVVQLMYLSSHMLVFLLLYILILLPSVVANPSEFLHCLINFCTGRPWKVCLKGSLKKSSLSLRLPLIFFQNIRWVCLLCTNIHRHQLFIKGASFIQVLTIVHNSNFNIVWANSFIIVWIVALRCFSVAGREALSTLLNIRALRAASTTKCACKAGLTTQHVNNCIWCVDWLKHFLQPWWIHQMPSVESTKTRNYPFWITPPVDSDSTIISAFHHSGRSNVKIEVTPCFLAWLLMNMRVK